MSIKNNQIEIPYTQAERDKLATVSTSAEPNPDIASQAVAEAGVDNDAWLRARNNADDADVNILKVNASDAIEFSANPVVSAYAAPTADAELAPKKYVDDEIAALGDVAALAEDVTAGEAFAANSVFAVRWAKGAETAGRLRKADNDASAEDNFHVVGLILPSEVKADGDTVTIYRKGPMPAASHGFTVGIPLWLGSSGALTQTAPSTNNAAAVIVGIPIDANNIDVIIHEHGVN